MAAVKIIECPRDAWQGLPDLIPPGVKAEYLQKLVDVGFRHIDAVSFVSPAAIPQMADSAEVLRIFKPPPAIEVIGIVANIRGAERAIATGAVHTLGFPFSISNRFLERNQRQTKKDSLGTLAAISDMARARRLGIVAYISMAFGNPYGEPWSAALVLQACAQLADIGIGTVSLADTIGAGTPEIIQQTVSAVLASHADIEFGVHLHARPSGSAPLIEAAYHAGCRRFDSAIGGLGGCPFAQDDLLGNIATEVVLRSLTDLGAELPEIAPLDALTAINTQMAQRSFSAAQ